jgi:hypothetical protein
VKIRATVGSNATRQITGGLLWPADYGLPLSPPPSFFDPQLPPSVHAAYPTAICIPATLPRDFTIDVAEIRNE